MKHRDVWHVLSASCGEQQYRTAEAEKYAMADAMHLVSVGEPVTIWKTSEIAEEAK